MAYELDDLLRNMVQLKASDLHLRVGAQPVYRIDGELTVHGEERLTAEWLMAAKELVLTGTPGNQTARLNWMVKTILPVTTTWRIDYYTQTANVYLYIALIVPQVRSSTGDTTHGHGLNPPTSPATALPALPLPGGKGRICH